MSTSAGVPRLPARQRSDGDKRENITAVSLDLESQKDRRLAEQVVFALTATGYGSLRTVEVAAFGGAVFLSGRVPSYYMKQVAQEIAMQVAGVREVSNTIEVIRL